MTPAEKMLDDMHIRTQHDIDRMEQRHDMMFSNHRATASSRPIQALEVQDTAKCSCCIPCIAGCRVNQDNSVQASVCCIAVKCVIM